MEKHIFYPGHDPVERKSLKTFYCQDDDIVFFFHQGTNQHWNFENSFDRAQCYAFLIDNYTDRKSFLKNDSKKKDPIISAEIGFEEIVLQHKSGAKSDPELYGLLFHLLILDLVNSADIKHTWNESARVPYPWSELAQHKSRNN